jgi:hypothetical protein
MIATNELGDKHSKSQSCSNVPYPNAAHRENYNVARHGVDSLRDRVMVTHMGGIQ